MSDNIVEIEISQSVIDAIIAQAKAELPNEACGYLAGKDGKVTKNFALTNIDYSPEHFSFDPAEQFKTIKQARQEGLEILGNYHSHPQSPARPSVEDIKLAYDPDFLYFILSLQNNEPVLRAFNITKGEVAPRQIVVI